MRRRSPTWPRRDERLFNVFLDTSQAGNFSGEYPVESVGREGHQRPCRAQTLTLNVTANVVPEPSTLALLVAGGIGLLVYVWRRKGKRRLFLISIMTAVLAAGTVLTSATARGQYIYVTSQGTGQYTGTIGEYTTSGGTVNATLVLRVG